MNYYRIADQFKSSKVVLKTEGSVHWVYYFCCLMKDMNLYGAETKLYAVALKGFY